MKKHFEKPVAIIEPTDTIDVLCTSFSIIPTEEYEMPMDDDW